MSFITPTTTWTEQQVRDLLEREKFAYQRIELPYGLHTSGDDRSATSRTIFPNDMTGKTVLDIGSFSGFFCFEALKRGAKSAVGIEMSADHLRRARLLADCLGLPAEFRQGDIEKDPVVGKFDYVLCLNVLHHLKNPLSALEKLAEATRERLILEVASVGRHDRRKLGISLLGSFFLKREPIFYVASAERSGQKFFISPGAIEGLLLSHRKTFAAVDILPSEHKERFMAVAHRRHIQKLVVIAGPTSAGKSTLIEKLRGGHLPELAKQLEMTEPVQWEFISAGSLAKFKKTSVEKLLFHYDFVRALSKSSKTYERDDALDILECAEETHFVTIWTPPDVLLRQLEQSEILPKTKNGVFRGNRRHARLHESYRKPQNVLRYYRDWINFCRTKPFSHRIVSFANGFKSQTPDEWECEANAKFSESNV